MSSENTVALNELIAIGNQCLQELRAMNATLQENNRQVRRKSSVAESVKMLLEEFPRPDWSAVELAKKIGNGCTDAAVRKTPIWKAYRKYQKNGRSDRSRKKLNTDDFIDEIDEKD